jgi:hypothetical protein
VNHVKKSESVFGRRELINTARIPPIKIPSGTPDEESEGIYKCWLRKYEDRPIKWEGNIILTLSHLSNLTAIFSLTTNLKTNLPFPYPHQSKHKE